MGTSWVLAMIHPWLGRQISLVQALFGRAAHDQRAEDLSLSVAIDATVQLDPGLENGGFLGRHGELHALVAVHHGRQLHFQAGLRESGSGGSGPAQENPPQRQRNRRTRLHKGGVEARLRATAGDRIAFSTRPESQTVPVAPLQQRREAKHTSQRDAEDHEPRQKVKS